MRAYLIAQAGAGPDFFAAGDALVLDIGAVIRSPSVSTSLAMVAERRAVRRLLRVDGIDAPDLDACLAATLALEPDAIVLPARHGRDIAHLGSLLAVHEAEHGLPDGGIGIVAIVSCAAGMLAAASFVDTSPRLRGLGWDATALARQLGISEGAAGSAPVASNPRPHPEVPQRSGGLQPVARSLEPSFEARLRLAPQGECEGGGSDPWGASPVLAHARAVVGLTAAAAGVEAIEAAYMGGDAEGFGAHVAAARRDGFGAMFVHDPAQARRIRAGA